MKSIRTTFLVTCTFLALLECEQVHAGPILWSSGSGGNDHFYDFIQVSDPFTGSNNAWATVSAAAAASVFSGQNGYLATITSQAENDFLLSLVPAGLSEGAGAWLGGKSPEGWLVGPEAGQAFSFTNFGGGEPNNAGYAYMIIGTTFAGVSPGQWADDSGIQGTPDSVGDRVIGYFVEYPQTTAVPEPSTSVLFGSGLAVLAMLRRKRRMPGVNLA